MQHNDDGRRSFLKQVLSGTAVVAGVALSGKKAKAKQQQTVQQGDDVLYKETEAFKKYYQSLR